MAAIVRAVAALLATAALVVAAAYAVTFDNVSSWLHGALTFYGVADWLPFPTTVLAGLLAVVLTPVALSLAYSLLAGTVQPVEAVGLVVVVIALRAQAALPFVKRANPR